MTIEEVYQQKNDMRTPSSSSSTNQLINNAEYETTYKHMKVTFGRPIRDQWMEKTDPNKHVFEDCGIASYLLELWRKFGIQPKKDDANFYYWKAKGGPREILVKNIVWSLYSSFYAAWRGESNGFVDIGCGNGLLVHLLTKSNIPGFGVDVRERKSWALFRQEGIDIRQFALNPSEIYSTKQLLGDSDFLIGNHSDELTPWVPVMAARLQCNFFLLPCCPFNFYSKFAKYHPKLHLRQIVGGLSEQYYAYIKSICRRLGFTVMTDELRISSRKKKCFVGIISAYGLAPNIEEIISELLEEAKRGANKDQFTPLPPKLEVRNCTQIPWEIRLDLAKRIVQFLINRNPQENISGWRCGGPEMLSTVSEKVLTTADRELLSKQDKGLQTFLRNFYQLFLVQKGWVSIRKWPTDENAKSARMKNQYCKFKQIHPDGCPVTDEECCYLH